MGCKEDWGNYEVYLAVKGGEDGEWKKDSARDKVTFQVKNLGKGGKVVWGPGANTDDQWSNWTLRVETNGNITMNVPASGKAFCNMNSRTVRCQKKTFESTLKGRGMEVNVAAVENDVNPTELKVEVDVRQCKQQADKWECDISFASGLNLNWKT